MGWEVVREGGEEESCGGGSGERGEGELGVLGGGGATDELRRGKRGGC